MGKGNGNLLLALLLMDGKYILPGLHVVPGFDARRLWICNAWRLNYLRLHIQ
jgi:hypothetical protein